MIGNRKARRDLRKELSMKPLTLCKKPMEEMNEMKFLGDYLCVDLEESVHKTVVKRAGMAKMAINEIRTVIEDTRASQLGGINLAFTLWNSAIVPSLLWNSETWTNIKPKTMKVLNDIFNQFYRSILRISKGCPKVNLYWQTGSYLPQNLILKNKLNFVHHLSNLPEQCLAKEVYRIQEVSSFPSLFQEVGEHLANLGITTPEGISKRTWKQKIERYIFNRNKEDLIGMATNGKKVNSKDLLDDSFCRKPYFYQLDIEAARYRFRISSLLVHTIRGNYSGKYRKKNEPLTCPSCRNQSNESNLNHSVINNEFPTDSQSHVLVCPAFSDLRENMDLEDDRELVEFFKSVVERRIKNGED